MSLLGDGCLGCRVLVYSLPVGLICSHELLTCEMSLIGPVCCRARRRPNTSSILVMHLFVYLAIKSIIIRIIKTCKLLNPSTYRICFSLSFSLVCSLY